uniref:Uncharacterized protein n=1 Tax=Rhizophora mucronata TaxID=61149 RepID=A0A2P2NHY0_RHIMU
MHKTLKVQQISRRAGENRGETRSDFYDSRPCIRLQKQICPRKRKEKTKLKRRSYSHKITFCT